MEWEPRTLVLHLLHRKGKCKLRTWKYLLVYTRKITFYTNKSIKKKKIQHRTHHLKLFELSRFTHGNRQSSNIKACWTCEVAQHGNRHDIAFERVLSHKSWHFINLSVWLTSMLKSVTSPSTYHNLEIPTTRYSQWWEKRMASFKQNVFSRNLLKT